jgi:hypothetical protein
MELTLSDRLIATCFSMFAACGFIGFAFIGHLHTPEGQIVMRIAMTGIILSLVIVPASLIRQAVGHAISTSMRRRRSGKAH